jgi:alpha-beta hydrolase superfamily lysophospholipase
MECPLSTTDGFKLRARWWRAARPKKATVVLVHGFAASTSQSAVVAQAEALTEAGYDVFSYDSRGHGDSGGLCTLGDLEVLDVAAAVERVRSPDHPVVLVGASMGAIAALRYAAREAPGVAGVVSISCPASWQPPRSLRGLATMAITRTGAGRLLIRRWMKVRLSPCWTGATPPVELAASISVPVAVVHGTDDRMFAPSDAEKIYRSCPGPRRLDIVPAMGHAFDRRAAAAIRAAVDWVVANCSATVAGARQAVAKHDGDPPLAVAG